MIESIEAEIVLIDSNESMIKFKYKRDNGGATIEREITPGPGGFDSSVDIQEIRQRSEDLKIVADHFDVLSKLPVT